MSAPAPCALIQAGRCPRLVPLTQNGKFHRAAQEAKSGRRAPERVRVYEKIHTGIWAYNGVFHLIDSWRERDEYRSVFKFRLVAVEGDEDFDAPAVTNPMRRRIIPTAVKLAVWKRDGGKCVVCGAADELHFDHDFRGLREALPSLRSTCSCCVLGTTSRSAIELSRARYLEPTAEGSLVWRGPRPLKFVHYPSLQPHCMVRRTADDETYS